MTQSRKALTVLAIDTARSEGSVCIATGGIPAGVLSLGHAPRFDRVLFGAIQKLLADCGVGLADMDGFGAATGPGSFTGIRVGLSAAKALAEAHQRPLVGVSSLRAVAVSAGSGDGKAVRVALLDARRGELFAGFYDSEGRASEPERFGSWEDLAPSVDGQNVFLVTNEPSTRARVDAVAPTGLWAPEDAPACQAPAVALLATRDIKAGRGCLPEMVDANYVRRPSVTLPSQAAHSKP